MLRPVIALAMLAVALTATALAAGRPSERMAGAAERCLGAASHDPQRPCVNRRLRLRVKPRPSRPRGVASACTRAREDGAAIACRFGVAPERAVRTVALVGDSHAEHWRPALERVARAEGWHGVLLARSSCPLSTAPRAVPEPDRSGCEGWNRNVLRWLGEHAEVDTVFLGQLSGGMGVIGPDGRDSVRAREQGYLDAWRQLPPSVSRIVVIRDTPKALRGGRMAACVLRSMARRQAPGPACSVTRAEALDPDAAVRAARASEDQRIRTLDLTRFFCGTRRCPPVIGGVLVYRDAHHLTPAYMTTMAPYLRRQIAALDLR